MDIVDTAGSAVQLPYNVFIDMNDMGGVQLAFVVILAFATAAIAFWIEVDKRSPAKVSVTTKR